MRKYYQHNGEGRFKKLHNELIELNIPKDILEEICKEICISRYTKNKYHLGMFYLLGNKLLLACHYFKLYVNENPDDRIAWINYQFASLRRGDISTSAKALNNLIRIEASEKEIRIALAMHNIASGRDLELASRIAEELIKVKPLDNFILMVIFEVAMSSRNYKVISGLMNVKEGIRYIEQSSNQDKILIRNILIERILYSLCTEQERLS